jgi:hypothetical protein
MESKKNKTSSLEKIQKSKTPSAVDDAADVMSKYPNKKKKYQIKDKKLSFPPIDYEKPPHY